MPPAVRRYYGRPSGEQNESDRSAPLSRWRGVCRGVLAYGVEPDRAEEDMVLRIHWLYVATEFRGQGIADMLLGSIIAEGLAAGIDYFTFDFQDEKPETQVFYNLFSDWHFSFAEGLAPEFMTVPKAKDAAGFRYALWRRRRAACPE